MKLYLFFTILVTFLFTACGDFSFPKDRVSSLTSIKKDLVVKDYTIKELETKVTNDELKIFYDANKSISLSTSFRRNYEINTTKNFNKGRSLSTSSLYVITNKNNESIFATIDADSTADEAEVKTKLLMKQNFAQIVLGYVNINTPISNINATQETILAEVERAFQQFTLQNVIAPATVVENKELNITYQTDFQNQDKTFTCNSETVVVDAQKGYSTLSGLTSGTYVCKHGDVTLLSFMVTIPLDLKGATVSIPNGTFPAGTTPTVKIPAFPTENVVGDRNISVTQTLNGTAVEAETFVNAQSGENIVVYTISETAGDKESKSVRVSFTLTELAAPAPAPNSNPAIGQP